MFNFSRVKPSKGEMNSVVLVNTDGSLDHSFSYSIAQRGVCLSQMYYLVFVVVVVCRKLHAIPLNIFCFLYQVHHSWQILRYIYIYISSEEEGNLNQTIVKGCTIPIKHLILLECQWEISSAFDVISMRCFHIFTYPLKHAQ